MLWAPFINYRDTCRQRVSTGTAVPTHAPSPRNGRQPSSPRESSSFVQGGAGGRRRRHHHHHGPVPGGDLQSPPNRDPALIGRVAAAEAAARGRAAAWAGGGCLTFHRTGFGLLPPGHVRALGLVLLVFLSFLPFLPFSLAPPHPPPNFARRSGSSSSGIDYLIFSLFCLLQCGKFNSSLHPPSGTFPRGKI